MQTIKPFRYIPELDCFVVTPEFSVVIGKLGLMEWSSVVWMGRLFARDNDFGEHWFDNWDERSALELKAADLGIDSDTLMIIVPQRFSDGTDGRTRRQNFEEIKADGPCHTPELRKMFWRDVLKSLEISYEFLFALARANAIDEAAMGDEHPDSDFSTDARKLVEQQIADLSRELPQPSDASELERIKDGIKHNDITMIVDGGDMIDHGWTTQKLCNKKLAEQRNDPRK